MFGELLESSLDYVVKDTGTAARWVGADSFAIAESPFPTDHKGLLATFRFTGMGGWNIKERAHRRRPGRSLKAWALVDPAAFATKLGGELGVVVRQLISRVTHVLRATA